MKLMMRTENHISVCLPVYFFLFFSLTGKSLSSFSLWNVLALRYQTLIKTRLVGKAGNVQAPEGCSFQDIREKDRRRESRGL